MRINVFFIVCFPKGATRRLQARVCFAGRRDFATVARVTPEFFDSLPFIHETSLQPIPKRSTRLRPDCCIGDSPMLIPGHASGMMWKRVLRSHRNGFRWRYRRLCGHCFSGCWRHCGGRHGRDRRGWRIQGAERLCRLNRFDPKGFGAENKFGAFGVNQIRVAGDNFERVEGVSGFKVKIFGGHIFFWSVADTVPSSALVAPASFSSQARNDAQVMM